ncbi:transcriptional regulator [Paenibacillus polymyxa]|uniref:MarR family winged helix-turn-helix transcriptional regulator n=1 Tax=Paenibacillus jamilae TaxID=114136 RepID=UPI0007AB236D|nr:MULTISPECIES: MarR family transcriptional regulator [Paenibacillus]KZE68150.1 transcriptional regulator [Paenibacillus jamilae]OBA01579.1 transcriptional regulator [Paenibacillus polymyxa]
MGSEVYPVCLPWEEESTMYLIKWIFTTVRREIETALRPLGLTSPQSQTLYILAMSPGITNTDLEKLLLIDKSSVTSLINGIVKKNWAVRQCHPEDARMKQIYLTKQGLEIHKVAERTIEQIKSSVGKTLSAQESEALRGLLKKILHDYHAANACVEADN